MIAHQGGKTIYIGPRCAMCRAFKVKTEGAYCQPCRETSREKKAIAGLFFIFLLASLLIMGLASAYGAWVGINGSL